MSVVLQLAWMPADIGKADRIVIDQKLFGSKYGRMTAGRCHKRPYKNLHYVFTCSMSANNDGIIIYANKAVLDMMKVAENDIRIIALIHHVAQTCRGNPESVSTCPVS
jgi:hypothetical protein